MKTAFVLTLALSQALWAQHLKLSPRLEALGKIAKETVEVTVDTTMLRFAERFLSDNDADQMKAKRVLRGLNGVTVKVFEFESAGQYSMADLDDLRAQLRGPGWSRMIEVRSQKEDNVDIYARIDGGAMTGMVVLSAEPKELAIIQIDGPIRPEELASLSGRMGIPRIPFVMGRR